MYRSSWIHQADTQRRQARRRDASVMAVIFLVGALGVSWFVLRPDLSALLPQPHTPSCSGLTGASMKPLDRSQPSCGLSGQAGE